MPDPWPPTTDSSQSAYQPGPPLAQADYDLKKRPSHASLHLSGVYLLTSRDDHRIAVPGLGLTLDNEGVTVLRPDGTVAVQIPAPQITSIQVSARSETPDGSTALIVEAATAQRSHRFVIPTSDSVDLARSFSDYAENLKIGEQQDAVASDQAIEFADGQGGGRRLVARFLIGLVVAVVTVAVVAVLLVGIGKI